MHLLQECCCVILRKNLVESVLRYERKDFFKNVKSKIENVSRKDGIFCSTDRNYVWQ